MMGRNSSSPFPKRSRFGSLWSFSPIYTAIAALLLVSTTPRLQPEEEEVVVERHRVNLTQILHTYARLCCFAAPRLAQLM